MLSCRHRHEIPLLLGLSGPPSEHCASQRVIPSLGLCSADKSARQIMLCRCHGPAGIRGLLRLIRGEGEASSMSISC